MPAVVIGPHWSQIVTYLAVCSNFYHAGLLRFEMEAGLLRHKSESPLFVLSRLVSPEPIFSSPRVSQAAR